MTLLPVVSKILGRIVIDRIRMGIDHRFRKEQAGFRSGTRDDGANFHFKQYFIASESMAGNSLYQFRRLREGV